MLCWSLDDSSSQFWQPAKIENVANPDFDHLKHVQNPVYLPLIEASMYWLFDYLTY